MVNFRSVARGLGQRDRILQSSHIVPAMDLCDIRTVGGANKHGLLSYGYVAYQYGIRILSWPLPRNILDAPSTSAPRMVADYLNEA